MNKPGYYKGELRPCECGHTDNCRGATSRHAEYFYIVCNAGTGGCGKQSGWYESIEEAQENWNTRLAFDKAIDALVDYAVDGTFKDYDSHETFISENIEKLTGLTYAEALEIYKQRQS